MTTRKEFDLASAYSIINFRRGGFESGAGGEFHLMREGGGSLTAAPSKDWPLTSRDLGKPGGKAASRAVAMACFVVWLSLLVRRTLRRGQETRASRRRALRASSR